MTRLTAHLLVLFLLIGTGSPLLGAMDPHACCAPKPAAAPSEHGHEHCHGNASSAPVSQAEVRHGHPAHCAMLCCGVVPGVSAVPALGATFTIARVSFRIAPLEPTAPPASRFAGTRFERGPPFSSFSI